MFRSDHFVELLVVEESEDLLAEFVREPLPRWGLRYSEGVGIWCRRHDEVASATVLFLLSCIHFNDVDGEVVR